MRAAVLLMVIGVAPLGALADAAEKSYYLGEAKLSSPSGQPAGSQVVLMEKTLDRDNSTIVERAIVVHADGKAEEHTMRMAVKEDNTFTLEDDAKTLTGSGTLFGPAWKWTYFKATFKANNGVQIEDENFMAEESVCTARKKVIGPDGKVVLYMEMSLEGISAKTFEILRSGLVKK